MQNSIRAGTLLLAGYLALACGPAKTKEPVETTSDAGKTTSPSGAAADRRGTTLVRVVNALPGKTAVDVTADERILFGNIAYQDVTDFQEMKENVARFTVRHAGKDSVLADNREVLGDGARYTLIALPDGKGGTVLRVLRDELVTDPGKTKIRVVNAAPGVEEVKVTVQGETDPLFDGVALGAEAGYRDIDPTTATLVFRSKVGKPLVRVEAMRLDSGRAYTVVLTGTGRRVEAVRFDDRLVRSASQVSLRP